MARIEQVLAGEKTWGAWWLDQLGHTGLGAAYSLPAFILSIVFGWPLWAQFALAAFTALFGGAIREMNQYEKTEKLHLRDRVLDTVFHLPGVAVSFGLVKLTLVFF